MTAPVAQTDGPRAMSAPTLSASRSDREDVERFRDAMTRRGGRREQRVTKEETQADRREQASAPMPDPSLPLYQEPRKAQDKPGPHDDKAAPGPARAADTNGPVAIPATPVGASAADAAAFAALVARFDAGVPASAATQIALPGDLWRAEQVVIDQQAGGLSVSIDLGAGNDGKDEAHKELEARLRARGLKATVSRTEPNRIADPSSRIA
ncbi:hypothetical protein MOK15_21360 [Sphingobium sp. BYY-5]|uniref:hypothetical protein n=1 Tax=Sphingobium sp. BYY-5 TaxID=2926400 RepID=UPI001FA6EABF|nr:hypothetical protein [Sphingobium sp. BYY-5]MCI4592608.1 hypothetical protein [Sphingobium sp. BYY-5]